MILEDWMTFVGWDDLMLIYRQHVGNFDGNADSTGLDLVAPTSVQTHVTTGANSATQAVASTTGMTAGMVLWFQVAAAFRMVLSITDATHVVLTSAVASTLNENIIEAVICKKHDTDNYDDFESPAGQSKVNNIMTSDLVECPIYIDLRAEDTVLLRQPSGRMEYFTVAGAPKSRDILNYTKAYLTTKVNPTITATGIWAAT